MEKSLVNYLQVGRVYDEKSIKELSPLALAYVGDSVYELLVRTHILNKNYRPKELHRRSIAYVKAKSQHQQVQKMMEQFSQEEMLVYRRGRNAKSHTMPKNATVADYRAATGLETLFGYLYLLGREERILEIFMEMVKNES